MSSHQDPTSGACGSSLLPWSGDTLVRPPWPTDTRAWRRSPLLPICCRGGQCQGTQIVDPMVNSGLWVIFWKNKNFRVLFVLTKIKNKAQARKPKSITLPPYRILCFENRRCYLSSTHFLKFAQWMSTNTSFQICPLCFTSNISCRDDVGGINPGLRWLVICTEILIVSSSVEETICNFWDSLSTLFWLLNFIVT